MTSECKNFLAWLREVGFSVAIPESLNPGRTGVGAGGLGKISGPTGPAASTVLTVHLDAIAFAQQWVQAWNTHDVEAVLQHFHDDVVFTSPVAAKLLPQTQGMVHGKAALRRYWTTAVQRIPDLHFVVEGVYQGIDTLVITYRNQNNALVNEVLKFNDDGLVIEGHGTYSIAAQGK